MILMGAWNFRLMSLFPRSKLAKWISLCLPLYLMPFIRRFEELACFAASLTDSEPDVAVIITIPAMVRWDCTNVSVRVAELSVIVSALDWKRCIAPDEQLAPRIEASAISVCVCVMWQVL